MRLEQPYPVVLRPGIDVTKSVLPGMRSGKAKEWIFTHQISANAWYVNSPNLTAAETRRLERVGNAVEELLDKIG